MKIADLNIRNGSLAELQELQKLFIETIETMCKLDYTAEQIEAWTAAARNQSNQERWIQMFDTQLVLVAESKGKILGFATLDGGSYIDFLYVHKDYQGMGIASALYSKIEDEAVHSGSTYLTSDVSITALPFFTKQGFQVVNEQTVIRQGVELRNFNMRKDFEK